MSSCDGEFNTRVSNLTLVDPERATSVILRSRFAKQQVLSIFPEPFGCKTQATV